MKPPHKAALINPTYILNASFGSFRIRALELFQYQYEENLLYQQYCKALRVDVSAINDVWQIPFLPISFFKTHTILSKPATIETADLTFESSGTTGTVNSRHYVWDAQVYEDSLFMGFEEFYGNPSQYAILALLPSYLERANASLVYMAKTLMAAGGHPANGFYINEWEKLHQTITTLESQNTKVLLIGVTFALLDFADAYPMQLKNTIVMETGGMKGRRTEITRTEVHDILKAQWGLSHIHSEYGMTELLSQAYALTDGIFCPTTTMQVFVRDINDPLDVSTTGTGALNIIDLANMHSCAFIATEDIARIHENGTFEVLGRLDHSALRGCSLMAV